MTIRLPGGNRLMLQRGAQGRPFWHRADAH
jgi:hypothetical protein